MDIDKILKKIERRNSLTPKEVIEQERKRLERERIKRQKEFRKMIKEKYGFDFEEE